MDLTEKLKAAAEFVKNMTPEEKEATMKAQRESWVRAEMSWPEAKYKMVNGVKVYESYADYCNG